MRLTEADAKELGSTLRKHRESAGMSRAALGRLIERDPATIQAYEQGGKKVYGTWIVATPNDHILEQIANALSTSREALCLEAGLTEASDPAAAEAMAMAASHVRAVNAEMRGVTVRGKAEDVAALLSLALERGLLGKLEFTPIHAD